MDMEILQSIQLDMRLIWMRWDMRFFRYTTGYERDDMDEMDMRFFRYTTGYER